MQEGLHNTLSLSYEDVTGLNLGSSDYYALNALTLLLAVFFASQAGLHRYTSQMKNRARYLPVMSILVGLLFLVGIGVIAFEIPTSPSDAICSKRYANGTASCSLGGVTSLTLPNGAAYGWLLKLVTGIMALVHLILSGFAYRFQRSNSTRICDTVVSKIDAASSDLMAVFVTLSWGFYLVIEFLSQIISSPTIQGATYSPSDYTAAGQDTDNGLSSTGLIGCIYLVFHSFALLCEGQVTFDVEPPMAEVTEQEEGNHIFTTTIVSIK